MNYGTLDRVDKNGTKYYHSTTCYACGGTGTRNEYLHVEAGRCFVCGGSGYKFKKWKEYTPEYSAILRERRLAKARKNADKTNAEFFKREGLNENGEAWICLGNTYAIKDELKEAGARYNAWLGWHFDHEADNTVKLTIDEMCEKNIVDEYSFKPVDFINEAIEAKMPKDETSEYMGEVGEKLEVVAVLDKIAMYETHYTYYGEVHHIYRFVTEEGNVVIWNTSSYQDLELGHQYTLTGKVKEHSEYKGTKQTVLQRCKIREAK